MSLPPRERDSAFGSESGHGRELRRSCEERDAPSLNQKRLHQREPCLRMPHRTGRHEREPAVRQRSGEALQSITVNRKA